MINMNEKMKKILKVKGGQASCLKINAIVNQIVNNTKIIKGCIIFDKDGTLEEDKINFTRILKMVGDKTGYEVSCNEFRFSQEMLGTNEILMLADKLSKSLSQKCTKIIVVYIALCNDEIELRFHSYRKDEGLWLDNDLDQYDIPILCWM